MGSRLVLASGSPTRRELLAKAGIVAEVVVSGVDETTTGLSTNQAVAELAARKAEAVAETRPLDLVLGCDSLLDLDGESLGKPRDESAVVATWRLLSGRQAVLYTGHCLIDGRASKRVTEVAATTVRFGRPSPEEIAAYAATGEPFGLAGSFSIDGYAAPFVDGIDGDPSNVLGLSLPVLRRLLSAVGIGIVDLWHSETPDKP
jgi:septum formation protein